MKKAVWGKDPEFLGPRDWFRNSLLLGEIKTKKESGIFLDFGCGSGSLLLRLAKDSFSGEGIEISSLSVKFLREKIKRENLAEKVKITNGNETCLFKIKAKFDIVVSGEVLEHLKEDRKAVQGFYRVLKKGGICVVSVPSHRWLWDINDEFSGHYRRYEKEDLKMLFKEVGFKVEKVYYWGFPITFLWHKLIYLPLIRKKTKTDRIYVNNSGFVGKILSSDWIKKVLCVPFRFDQLFNWTPLGGGLILVARK